MRRLVGDVEEEGLFLVALDEIDAAIGDDVGRVALHVRLPEPDAPTAVAVVVAGTVEQADEFVEAMVDRVVRVLMPAVPLAGKPAFHA